MKLKIKKTVLPLVLLPLAVFGTGANAYAANGNDYTDNDYDDSSYADSNDYDYSDSYDSATVQETEPMTVPTNLHGIRASVSYLLGQPTYNSAFLDVVPGVLNEQPQLGRIRPKFTQSGVAAELAYDFSNGKFVQADWMQFFKNTQSRGGTLIQGQAIPFEVESIGRTQSTFLRIGGDVGQTFYAGDNLLYRLSFGVQYARIGIAEDSLVRGSLELGDTTKSAEIPVFNRKSVFNGIGPRIGIGAEYDIGWNLKLVGNTSASLNVGNITATTPVRIDFDEEAIADGGKDTFRTVVPGLEGNLGIRYDYDLGSDNGILSTEIGYQVIGYFNSFSGIRDGFTSDLAANGETINSPTSYANQAVYLKLGYNGGFVS